MTMKLELKNIKHSGWASEETYCYQASLYVDGKPVAFVSNDGHGGSDRRSPHSSFKGDYRAVMAEVHEYFTTLPVIPTPLFEQGFTQELESWCFDQVNDWLTARELKRKLKKEFLFQFADKVGVFAHKTRPSLIADKATILNDLPFDEALAIWKETA